MGRTANIIIKDVIHVFASISKIMLILLMGRRNRERWGPWNLVYSHIVGTFRCVWKTAPWAKFCGPILAPNSAKIGQYVGFRLFYWKFSAGQDSLETFIYKLIGATFVGAVFTLLYNQWGGPPHNFCWPPRWILSKLPPRCYLYPTDGWILFTTKIYTIFWL